MLSADQEMIVLITSVALVTLKDGIFESMLSVGSSPDARIRPSVYSSIQHPRVQSLDLGLQ
jgi:hypothetical protein